MKLSTTPPEKRSWIATHVVPGIYIALVLIGDYLTPTSTFTPFFAVVGLMLMALMLKPMQMIPWAIIYILIICSIFLSPKLYFIFTHTTYDGSVIPLVRSGTYVIVGFIASYLCFILNRLRTTQEEMTVVLNKLPSAILLSNQNGKILYSNDTARHLIPELDKRRGFYSFFELLAPPERQGRSISDYLRRLEREENEKPMELSVYGRPYEGATRVLDWMGEKVLLTILTESGVNDLSK